MKRCILLIVLCLAVFIPEGYASATEQANCQELNNIFRGNVKSTNDICKLEIVRKQQKITWNGKELPPEMMGFAFTASFKKIDGLTVVMGEFALLEDEINTVIDVLRKEGLQVSALHNHWYGEQPIFYFLHFQGTGDAIEMAKAIEAAITKTAFDINSSEG